MLAFLCGFDTLSMFSTTRIESCAGQLMFLHTNLSPKWSLEIPAEFNYYNRRWQVNAGLLHAEHFARRCSQPIA